jgi:hypothetical protein
LDQPAVLVRDLIFEARPCLTPRKEELRRTEEDSDRCRKPCNFGDGRGDDDARLFVSTPS